MASLTQSLVPTPSGASIAVYEVGSGPHHVFMIGGIAGRTFPETPIAPAVEEAAALGVRFTLMEIAGSGASKRKAAPTMEGWLADIEHIFGPRIHAPATWVGASVGAWLMLHVQARNPAWFRAMCALAPAIDWDQQYVAPALVEGRLRMSGDYVTTPEGMALVHRDTVESMAPYHLLGRPLVLAAPLHIIFGGRDDMVPWDTTRRFFAAASGARCSATFLPGWDHGVAKLRPAAVRVHFQQWLAGQLDPGDRARA